MTISMIDEADLLAEHLAEKARKDAEEKARKDAEQEAQWAKWRIEQAEQQAKIVARQKSTNDAIALEVEHQGLKVVRREDGTIAAVGGFESFGLSFWKWPERLTVSVPTTKWDHRRGRSVSCHEDRQFPMRKGGVYNFEGIAQAVAGNVRRRQAEVNAEINRKRNESAASQLKQALGLPSYSDTVRPNSQGGEENRDKQVVLSISGTKAMTVEQAVEVVDFLRARGLMAPAVKV